MGFEMNLICAKLEKPPLRAVFMIKRSDGARGKRCLATNAYLNKVTSIYKIVTQKLLTKTSIEKQIAKKQCKDEKFSIYLRTTHRTRQM